MSYRVRKPRALWNSIPEKKEDPATEVAEPVKKQNKRSSYYSTDADA